MPVTLPRYSFFCRSITQIHIVEDAVLRHLQVRLVEEGGQLVQHLLRGHLRHKDDGIVHIAAVCHSMLDEEQQLVQKHKRTAVV